MQTTAMRRVRFSGLNGVQLPSSLLLPWRSTSRAVAAAPSMCWLAARLFHAKTPPGAGVATPEPRAVFDPGGWPPAIAPYVQLSRAEKPIGSILLFWPGAWSISLAAPAAALPDPYLLGAFAAGSLLMRGAGCTINDFWDRDIDAQVARTKSRPLACGAISPAQAVAWMGAQVGLSAVILLSLQPAAVVMAASSLGMVAAYPLAKRVTGWPQLMLGLTFNWGALVGWTAVHNELESGLAVVLPLYGAGIAWTLVYDTIYAHQDKRDDAKLNLGSTALSLGDGRAARLTLGAFGACTTAGLLAAGHAAEVGAVYYPLIGVSAAHLGWQIATVDFDDGADCMRKFVSNQLVGGLVFLACVAGKLSA